MHKVHLTGPDPRVVSLLILDLDGTVRKGKDELGRFVNGPEDVEVFPEALKLMREWHERGGRILGATNQGGVALGIVSEAKVSSAIEETIRQCQGLFSIITACTHHPDAKDPELARCMCRKPKPGGIIGAMHHMMRQTNELYPVTRALFVGDRDEDKLCASLMDIDFMWARDWRSTAV